MSIYLIALTYEARLAPIPVDLQDAIPRLIADGRVKILERGYQGRSVTVEVPDDLLANVRSALPFTTVEPDSEIDLI